MKSCEMLRNCCEKGKQAFAEWKKPILRQSMHYEASVFNSADEASSDAKPRVSCHTDSSFDISLLTLAAIFGAATLLGALCCRK